MASIAELTAQVVALTDQVQTLTSRVAVAEQNVTMSAPRTGRSNDIAIFDKKSLYIKELKENTSFRSWSERVHCMASNGQRGDCPCVPPRGPARATTFLVYFRIFGLCRHGIQGCPHLPSCLAPLGDEENTVITKTTAFLTQIKDVCNQQKQHSHDNESPEQHTR